MSAKRIGRPSSRFALALAAACLFALAAGLPIGCNADLTDNGRFSLSPYARGVLSALDREVKVTWYRSGNLSRVASNCSDVEGCLRDFSAASRGMFAFAIRDPETPDAGVDVGALGMQRRGEGVGAYSGLLVEYGSASDIIPFVADRSRLEYDLLVRILSLANKSRSELMVLFASPSGSATYPYVVPWLEHARYSVREISLPAAEIDPLLPLVVIGSSGVDTVTANAIEAFLDRGGSAAFFVSGVSVATAGDWSAAQKTGDALLPILSRRGAVIEGGMVLDESCWRLTMPSLDGTRYETVDYPFWPRFTPTTDATGDSRGLLNGVGTLQFFWPSGILVDAASAGDMSPIVMSSERSVVETQPFVTNPFEKRIESLRTESGKSSRHLAVAAETRGRFVCVSDELFPGTMGDYAGADANLDFLQNCADWISRRDGLLSVKKTWPTASAPTAGEISEMAVYYARIRVYLLAAMTAIAVGYAVARFAVKRRHG